jgi:hypothetical protein
LIEIDYISRTHQQSKQKEFITFQIAGAGSESDSDVVVVSIASVASYESAVDPEQVSSMKKNV